MTWAFPVKDATPFNILVQKGIKVVRNSEPLHEAFNLALIDVRNFADDTALTQVRSHGLESS